MRENVGDVDQTMRILAGPLLMTGGYLFMGGRKGRLKGLLTMMTGLLAIETAVTRVCPLNELLGIDTTGRTLEESGSPSERELTGASEGQEAFG